MTADTTHPPLIEEMRIDVYANAAKREVAVLYDRPFASRLQHLELDTAHKRLYFVFEDKRQDLGDEMKDIVMSIMQDHNIIHVIQMDVHTKQVQGGARVPLKILS